MTPMIDYTAEPEHPGLCVCGHDHWLRGRCPEWVTGGCDCLAFTAVESPRETQGT